MDQRVALCIDSDLRDLETQKEALEQAGFRVIAVDDARVGLAMFMTNDIDVVLLDFNFPKTDGGIIADEMRRRKPNVAIVLIADSTNKAAKQSRAVDIALEKPLDLKSLAARIEQLLKEKAAKKAKDDEENRRQNRIA